MSTRVDWRWLLGDARAATRWVTMLDNGPGRRRGNITNCPWIYITFTSTIANQ